MSKHTYTFTGFVAERFDHPQIGEVEPGATVTTDEPVHHARLAPTNDAAKKAADKEADRVLDALVDTIGKTDQELADETSADKQE